MATVHPRENPGIVVTPTDTLDGQPEDGNAQVIALGYRVGPGDVETVSADSPIPTGDYSAPFVGLTKGGRDATATSTVMVNGGGAQMKVDITHAGPPTDSANPPATRVWLGFDAPAVEGEGDYLDPGDSYDELTSSSVQILGGGRVTYQTWTT